MSAEIRRHQTTLICSGVAVIAFGLWSIVRSFLWLFFDNALIQNMIDEEARSGILAEISADKILTAFYIAIAVLVFLDLCLRIYVGLSAVSEGRGKHRRITYVILSCLFLAVSLYSDLSLLISYMPDALTLETVASFIVEFSSLIAFVEIIRASLRIRKYNRSTEASHAD